MSQSDDKYILAGLRMYGDILAECIEDPAMKHPEEAVNLMAFMSDQEEVERLIKKYEEMVK